MKLRLAFRCVFTIVLSIICVFLVIIFFDKAGKGASVIALSDYVIENKNESEECATTIEYIYTEGDKKYYLPCIMSNDIILVWDDGSKDYLKDALNNKKVTIESLQAHGLEIYEEEN